LKGQISGVMDVKKEQSRTAVQKARWWYCR